MLHDARPRLASCVAGLTVLLALAACQGNIGTGGGLPQPPGPQITPIAGAQTRTRSTDGAVFLETDVKSIPLPELGGFSVTIALEAPTPAPSGAPAGSSPAASGRSLAASAQASAAARLATAAPSAAPALPAPATSPAPKAPSPIGSGSPLATVTPRSALAANAKPKVTATPTGPKIDTKTTIYPDDAPAAPTPQPTGNVQSFGRRTALVRGWIMSRAPVTLYSLAAVRFTIPAQEQTKGRGFTVALFESQKHRKNRLMAWDPAAVLADNAVSAANVASEPLALRKNVGYYFVLYGDDLAPVPTPSGSFPPANNAVLGSPGAGTPVSTPMPGITPFATPTPYTLPR